MGNLIISEPTRVYFPADADLDKITKFLTFHDSGVDYQIHKLKQNFRWKRSDPEGFNLRIEELKKQQVRCILFQDEQGYYTYSGLAQELSQYFGWPIQNQVNYPPSKAIPWAKPPENEPRLYQAESIAALRRINHGSIEIPTGGGKTFIIDLLLKYHGLKSLIVTPSRSITAQIYNELKKLFGAKYVGMYGGTTKKTNKLFTVCTAQTLVRLQPTSQDYIDFYNNVKVLIFDESHTTPAETFDQVCMGVASQAPYRFFVSATQIDRTGSELVLKGITGPIVYKRTVKELINEGYLAKPVIKMFHVKNTDNPNVQDVHKETRNQLYCNPNVLSLAADIASKASRLAKRKVLILIDEFTQYELLKNYLVDQHTFVSGETKAKERQQIFKDFNDGKIDVLVGTSAISTGVDLKPVGCLIYLQGGKSEIQIKQAIGRGTRLVPGKTDFWVIDFIIDGSDKMTRHAEARKIIYSEYADVEEVKCV